MRGGASRRRFARRATMTAFASSCRRATAPACAASWNMRVEDGSRGALLTRRAELRDEVVCVAAVIRLAELDGLAVAQIADALHEESGIAGTRMQQLRL